MQRRGADGTTAEFSNFSISNSVNKNFHVNNVHPPIFWGSSSSPTPLKTFVPKPE
jgi:hypothetical protein